MQGSVIAIDFETPTEYALCFVKLVQMDCINVT